MAPSGSGRRWSVQHERTCAFGLAGRRPLTLLDPPVARELGIVAAGLGFVYADKVKAGHRREGKLRH